jgi:hypothetical protein
MEPTELFLTINWTSWAVIIKKDVVIPWDWNVLKEEAEKILKYKDLITEIQRMWNVKT